MTTPINDLLKEIKDGLEGVTPGPWQLEFAESQIGSDTEGDYTMSGPTDNYIMCDTPYYPIAPNAITAAHIARCSPDNIARLLAHIEGLESRIAELEKADGWRPRYGDIPISQRAHVDEIFAPPALPNTGDTE